MFYCVSTLCYCANKHSFIDSFIHSLRWKTSGCFFGGGIFEGGGGNFSRMGFPEELYTGKCRSVWGNFPGGNVSRENCPENSRTPMQDYKSLRAAVMIWATVVNTHTHTHTHRQLTAGYISLRLARTGWNSWANNCSICSSRVHRVLRSRFFCAQNCRTFCVIETPLSLVLKQVKPFDCVTVYCLSLLLSFVYFRKHWS